MKCKNCGLEIGQKKFCGYCGQESKASHKKLLALIFVLLIVIIIGGVFASDFVGSKTKLKFQDFSEEDIVYMDGMSFVDSQLILTVDSEYSFDDVKKIVREYDGKIVGAIEITNDYQVQFDNLEYSELIYLSNMLSARLGTADVRLHKVYRLEDETSEASYSSNMPGDWWRNSIWLKNTEECNYDYKDVKVAIFDSEIDITNKDIKYAVAKQWNKPKSLSETSHGTEVAGFISAKINNGFGIDGTSNNSKLYCFDYDGEDECYFNSSNMKYKYALASMLTKGVKIINFSNGYDEMLVGAQIGKKKASAELEEFSNDLSVFLEKFIDSGYEFIIVKAAGNVCNKTWIECEVTEKTPFGVKKYIEEQDGELDNYTQINSKVFSAEYDIFGAITDQKVKDRVVIVGSVRKNGTVYEVCDFSVRGSRVDIFAPGQDLTALTSSLDANKSTEDNESGTSFSAPMVTGVASLVWGANPSLTSSEVRECLIGTTDYSVQGEDAGVINAFFAVKHALAFRQLDSKKAPTKGVLMGVVKLKGEDEYTFANKAMVSVLKNEEEIACVETDEYGCFDTLIDSGKYTINITYDGYHDYSKSLEVRRGEVCYLDDVLLVNENEVDYVSGNNLIAVDEKIIYAKGDGVYYKEGVTGKENKVATIRNVGNLLSDGQNIYCSVSSGSAYEYVSCDIYKIAIEDQKAEKIFTSDGRVTLITNYNNCIYYVEYTNTTSSLKSFDIKTEQDCFLNISDHKETSEGRIVDVVHIGQKLYVEMSDGDSSYGDNTIIEFDLSNQKSNVYLEHCRIVSENTNAQEDKLSFATVTNSGIGWQIYSVDRYGNLEKSEKIPSKLTLSQGVITSDGLYAIMMSGFDYSDFDLYKVNLKTGDTEVIENGAGGFKGKGCGLGYDEVRREDIYLIGSGDIISQFNGNGYEKLKVDGNYDPYMCWVVDGYVINRDFEWCKIEN